MNVPATRRLTIAATSGAACATVLLSACSAGVTGGGPSASSSASSTPTPPPAVSDAASGGSASRSENPPTGLPGTSDLPTGSASVPDRSASGHDSSPGSQDTSRLPQAFPLPPGARITAVTRDDHEIVGQITVTDRSSAFDYWRRALPTAGYDVTHSDSAFGASEIDFAGHGCSGDSQIAISPANVTVQCDLG